MDAQKVEKQKDMIENTDGCGCNKKGGYKTLTIDGVDYQTTFNKKYNNRKNWEKPNEKNVISYIPGTIKELFVKEGETVKAGEKMLVFEAMKMLNTIVYPLTGKIKKVHVKVGSIVPKGLLMVEYE